MSEAPELDSDADAPIARRSLTDEAVERLRDQIVAGRFAPGERLPERTLCERFGISRTPLREAMKVLAAEGLIKLLPNRGAVVPTLSPRELAEAFEVMEALEAMAGELACKRIEDAALRQVRRMHERMVARYREGDLQGYFKLNQQIHRAIVHAAHNEALADIYQRLAGRVLRARYAANLSGTRWAQAVAEHEAILHALERRDGPGLARLLREHLRNKYAVVRQSGVAAEGG